MLIPIKPDQIGQGQTQLHLGDLCRRLYIYLSYHLSTNCGFRHRLTHSYLLNNEERPECIPCYSNYSLRHVLIDCVDVADVRQTFYNDNSLYDLFTNVGGETIFKFVKEINSYTKI